MEGRSYFSDLPEAPPTPAAYDFNDPWKDDLEMGPSGFDRQSQLLNMEPVFYKPLFYNDETITEPWKAVKKNDSEIAAKESPSPDVQHTVDDLDIGDEKRRKVLAYIEKHCRVFEDDPEVAYQMFVSHTLPMIMVPEKFRHRNPAYYVKFLLDLISIKYQNNFDVVKKEKLFRQIYNNDPYIPELLGRHTMTPFLPMRYRRRNALRYARYRLEHKHTLACFIEKDADPVSEQFLQEVYEVSS